jgi:ABC-type sugar transport system substrate-binding protein
MRSRFAGVLLAGVLLVAACGGDAGAGSHGGVRIGVVIKGLDNPYFAAMKQGLEAAARDRGADVQVRAATGLADTAGQAANLEALVEQDLGCYVVNPINQSNLINALSHLPDDVPIVNIDSPVGVRAARALGIKIRTYIGTDNRAAGALAAKAMAGVVGRDAVVAVIGGISGDATSAARLAGFRDGADGRFEPLPPVSADWDETKAMSAAGALLRAHPGIEGFFAANDQMALGIVRAVARAGRRGSVAVVGVDGIEDALASIRRGAMAATVSQYPYTMGTFAVDACVAATSGKPLPGRVDAPIQVITRANVENAQAKFPQPVTPFANPFAD